MITCPSCGCVFHTTSCYIRNNLLHTTNDPLSCLCSEWKDRKEESERKANLKSKEAFIYGV